MEIKPVALALMINSATMPDTNLLQGMDEARFIMGVGEGLGGAALKRQSWTQLWLAQRVLGVLQSMGWMF